MFLNNHLMRNGTIKTTVLLYINYNITSEQFIVVSILKIMVTRSRQNDINAMNYTKRLNNYKGRGEESLQSNINIEGQTVVT